MTERIRGTHRALITLALTALIASACGPASTPAGASPGASGPVATATAAGPKTGGTVVYGLTGANLATGLNTIPALPLATSFRNNPAIHVYDTLYMASMSGGIEDWLAEKTDVSADGLTWTITLRSGVKFHDGTSLDAAAVKKNLDIRKEHKTFVLKGQMGPISEVKAVDARTVQLVLSRPAAALRAILSSPYFSIQSPAAMEQYPEEEYFRHASGSGPFKLEGSPTDTELTLVRNPDYWGEKAFLDKVVWRTITDEAAGLAALESGDLQAATVPLPDLERVQNEKKLTVVEEPARNDYFWFNMSKSPISDQRVRQAIVLGMDRESYLKVSPGLVKSEGLVARTLFGHVPLAPHPYDPARAKQLLEQAGVQAGTTLDFITGDNPINTNIAQLMVLDLEKLGFKVNLSVSDTNSWVAKMHTPSETSNWHISLLGASVQYDDTEAVLIRWLYGPNDVPKGQNWSHYKNASVDKLIEQQQSMGDPDARSKVLGDIQKLIWDELPIFSPYARTLYHGVDPRLQGVDLQPTGRILWHRVWLGE